MEMETRTIVAPGGAKWGKIEKRHTYKTPAASRWGYNHTTLKQIKFYLKTGDMAEMLLGFCVVVEMREGESYREGEREIE